MSSPIRTVRFYFESVSRILKDMIKKWKHIRDDYPTQKHQQRKNTTKLSIINATKHCSSVLGKQIKCHT